MPLQSTPYCVDTREHYSVDTQEHPSTQFAQSRGCATTGYSALFTLPPCFSSPLLGGVRHLVMTSQARRGARGRKGPKKASSSDAPASAHPPGSQRSVHVDPAPTQERDVQAPPQASTDLLRVTVA